MNLFEGRLNRKPKAWAVEKNFWGSYVKLAEYVNKELAEGYVARKYWPYAAPNPMRVVPVY